MAKPSQSKLEDSFYFSLFSLLFTDLIISYNISHTIFPDSILLSYCWKFIGDGFFSKIKFDKILIIFFYKWWSLFDYKIWMNFEISESIYNGDNDLASNYPLS